MTNEISCHTYLPLLLLPGFPSFSLTSLFSPLVLLSCLSCADWALPVLPPYPTAFFRLSSPFVPSVPCSGLGQRDVQSKSLLWSSMVFRITWAVCVFAFLNLIPAFLSWPISQIILPSYTLWDDCFSVRVCISYLCLKCLCPPVFWCLFFFFSKIFY